MSRLDRSKVFVLTVIIFSLVSSRLVDAETKVQSIDFKVTGGKSEIEIKADGPIQFDKVENTQDKQLVLELKDTTLESAASRPLDTSSFNSPVKLISPYQLEKSGVTNNARVVVQLKDNQTSEVSADGNTLKISMPNGGGAGAEAGVEPAPAQAEAAKPDAVPAPVATQAAPAAAKKGDLQFADEKLVDTTPKTASEKRLADFLEARGAKPFSGKPISVKLKDAELADVFRLIGDASGFNIVVGDDVKGKVTLALTDVPWDQVLDMILKTNQLGAERNNNVLRITTLSNLTREAQQEQLAKAAIEASAPRITRVFPISYANLSDLQVMLTRFGTAGTSTTGNPTGSSSMTVQVDNRTNSIIVRDIPENIERMSKLIQILDTQTPQVLIESKIIEATEGFSKSVSGSFALGHPNSDQWFGSFAGGDPTKALLGNGGALASQDWGKASSNGAQFGGSTPGIGFFGKPIQINALLSLAESENTVNVVASPRTVVLNKESATITQGIPVLIPTTSTQNGNIITTESVQSADLSLNVTPTVTNDGAVQMELNITRNVPFPVSASVTAVANRSLKTKVLVDSGSTLVIGGVYTSSKTKAGSGIPWLRKIPIIGALFGSESETNGRSELFIFITPRILNEKESGLAPT